MGLFRSSKTARTEGDVPGGEAGLRDVRLMDIGGGSLWHQRRNLLICSCVCLSTFQYGFDYGLTAGLQAMPGFLAIFGYKDPSLAGGYGIGSTVQQLINSLMTVGAFVSSLSVGPLGKFVGRRWALWIACILNHVGAILMVASDDLAALYASRLIIGLANGLFMVETQLYVQECAVPNLRGFLMGIYQVCIALGSIIGSIVDNYTASRLDKSSYQIPCGCLFIVPTFLLVVLPFLPESPRWLLESGRDNEARKALVGLRAASTDHHVIDAELNEMLEATQSEREHTKGSIRLMEMFQGTNRRRTALTICLVVSLSATGNLLLVVYGTYFFALAGTSKPFAETVGMNCAGLAGVLLSLYVIRYVGRRTILLLGAGTQAICMLVIGAVNASGATSFTAGKCIVAFAVMHMFFYTMCTASYLYLAAGEMPSNRLRSLTLGIAVSLGFVGAWVVSFTVPYFINQQDLNWGAKYAWVWFGSNVAYFLFMFFFLPETKDRTLEEINEMFEKKVPAWKFKSYVCVETNDARVAGLLRNPTHEDKPAIEAAEFVEINPEELKQQ